MKRETIIRFSGAGLSRGGTVLIGMTANWWVAAGVFILITGNNIERRFQGTW